MGNGSAKTRKEQAEELIQAFLIRLLDLTRQAALEEAGVVFSRVYNLCASPKGIPQGKPAFFLVDSLYKKIKRALLSCFDEEFIQEVKKLLPGKSENIQEGAFCLISFGERIYLVIDSLSRSGLRTARRKFFLPFLPRQPKDLPVP